ncbi:MAG: DUF559 domain-containing protein [Planctomycetota bacterium]
MWFFRKLWRYLRARQLEGFKFFGDFVCYEKRIIVEVDGGLRCVERDGNRDWRFEVQGFKVLRFWNNEVLNNRQGGWK